MAAGGVKIFFREKSHFFAKFSRIFQCKITMKMVISKSIFSQFYKNCLYNCDQSVNFLNIFKEFLGCRSLIKALLKSCYSYLTFWDHCVMICGLLRPKCHFCTQKYYLKIFFVKIYLKSGHFSIFGNKIAKHRIKVCFIVAIDQI